MKSGFGLENGRGIILNCDERGILIARTWGSNFNLDWCYPEFKGTPSKKAVPLGVRFENKEEAIKCLEQFIEVLRNEDHTTTN